MILHYITRNPRLGPIDAQIVYPILLFLIWPRMWTLVLFFFSIIFLWYLNSKGIRIPMLARIVRSKMIGRKRQIRPPYRQEWRL
ncbi:hypothetical protein HNP46_000218 [Pseudomonas nitritireducens]|uniref:Intracellular multiplication protein IcmT n=1 Tax=Pseudomonas nitroreducens TaxID=46680 RepID=A0A7W7KEJ4_PSENT|nr:IcmT/TraK family protein [Pseudomonas nitritireducens]MBB4861407.1 hypothetical protein [Pseudomonas nitritireducens]